MDFVEGASLSLITTELTDAIYTDYCKQFLQILIDLHDNKIEFGQVNLNNIYLSKIGNLKLQLCKFNEQQPSENNKVAAGKALFKLIAQQDFQSFQQLEESKMNQKYKIFINDLIKDRKMTEICSNSQWILLNYNGKQAQEDYSIIQREDLELDDQLAKQISGTQKNIQQLKIRVNPYSTLNGDSDSNLSSTWDSDNEKDKHRVQPKGSTVLLEKIKQGLFKYQQDGTNTSTGKLSNKLSNKQATEDVRSNVITLPGAKRKLTVNTRKRIYNDSESDSEFSPSDLPFNDQELIKKKQFLNEICMDAYNFTKKPTTDLVFKLLQHFITLKEQFYQVYRQYLQPTLLLDMYNFISKDVDQWLYYIDQLNIIASCNQQIKGEILILGIQSLIYENLQQYFIHSQKQSQKIFFVISEYCQTIIQENQPDELKVLQLFLVNKGIQIISMLLKINSIFITNKQMIDAFTCNDKYLQTIGMLLNLINYCDQKGDKYQVYRLLTEDDNNSINVFIKFALALYDEQNIFSRKEENLQLLKQYLEFVIKAASSSQPNIIQTKENIQILTRSILKSDDYTKTLLLQLLTQICNFPSNEFLTQNAQQLENVIREQIKVYLNRPQNKVQEYVISNTEITYQLIQQYIKNSAKRTESLFNKDTVENLDKLYQWLIFSDYEGKENYTVALSVLQITAENILLLYVKSSENFEQLDVQVKTHLVQLALQQFVRQQKLQKLSIQAMYKLTSIYDFDRLKIDDLQQLNINYQYFESQIKKLDDVQWDITNVDYFHFSTLSILCEKCALIREHIFNASFLRFILTLMKQNEQETGFLEIGLQLFTIYFQLQSRQENYKIKNLQNKMISVAQLLCNHKSQTIRKLAQKIISYL